MIEVSGSGDVCITVLQVPYHLSGPLPTNAFCLPLSAATHIRGRMHKAYTYSPCRRPFLPFVSTEDTRDKWIGAGYFSPSASTCYHGLAGLGEYVCQ